MELRLHGGVGSGVLVCYDQQFVECSWLVAEELVLEQGALSAPGCEVLYGLHLVHPFAGVAQLGPSRQVVAGGLGGTLDAQRKLARLGRPF